MVRIMVFVSCILLIAFNVWRIYIKIQRENFGFRPYVINSLFILLSLYFSFMVFGQIKLLRILIPPLGVLLIIYSALELSDSITEFKKKGLMFSLFVQTILSSGGILLGFILLIILVL